MSNDVLIFGGTSASPDLRHAVPANIPDAFLYAERGGSRYAVLSQLDADGAQAAAPGLEVITPEELGRDDLIGSGISRHEMALEETERAVRHLGIERASVPPTFPVE